MTTSLRFSQDRVQVAVQPVHSPDGVVDPPLEDGATSRRPVPGATDRPENLARTVAPQALAGLTGHGRASGPSAAEDPQVDGQLYAGDVPSFV